MLKDFIKLPYLLTYCSNDVTMSFIPVSRQSLGAVRLPMIAVCLADAVVALVVFWSRHSPCRPRQTYNTLLQYYLDTPRTDFRIDIFRFEIQYFNFQTVVSVIRQETSTFIPVLYKRQYYYPVQTTTQILTTVETITIGY